MNASHSVGWIWWAPARCGTRSVQAFLAGYGFEEQPNEMSPGYPGKSHGYTHNPGIPAGCESYPVAMMVRNPYSRLVSMWHLECLQDTPSTPAPSMPFRDFAAFRGMADFGQALDIRAPDLLIRHESLAADVAALPFVDLSDPATAASYEANIIGGGQAWPGDWRDHYDAGLAAQVYERERRYFEAFGYGRDSWSR